MARHFHSSLILVAVFALGISAGVGTVVWAWPALHAKYFHPRHETPIQYFQRTLNLTPTEVPQVKAILDETRQRRDELHTQFVPQYEKICDDFTTARRAERDAYTPVRQDELQKLQSVLTPDQWQKLQQQSARNPPSQHRPDVCGHLGPAPGQPNSGSPQDHGPHGGPHAGPQPPGGHPHFF